MTEQEWLAATDPTRMLDSLRGKASDRKFRLFAVACCRRAWRLLPTQPDPTAVVAAERFADGLARAGELPEPFDQDGEAARPYVCYPPAEGAPYHADVAAYMLAREVADPADEADESAALFAAERRSQTALLRDVIGPLPFRPVPLDLAWLTPTVVSLAEAAYDHRALPAGTLEPERLALLADALEEGGCDNAEVLGHLRSEGPHVRGCWVLDLVLGRE